MDTTTADKLVLELFETVKQKQKEISATEKHTWLTSCTIGYNPDTVADRSNIQTVTDISKLVDIFAFLIGREELTDKANRELFGEPKKFVWMGYSISAWKQDIKARLAQINLAAKRKELAELESRLDKLITPEQRRELELAEISKLLGK